MTMVPIKTHLNQLVVRVKKVEYSISIGLLTGSEDYHIEVLPSFSQAFESKWPDVDSSVHGFRFIIEFDTDHMLRTLFFYVVHAVD